MKVKHICKHLGISQQAYYKSRKQVEVVASLEEQIIEFVKKVRCYLQECGGRKLYFELKKHRPELIKSLGRDKLFTLLAKHNLLVHKKKRYCHTTNSNHPFYKYPNLFKLEEYSRAENVLVSDITYIRNRNNFYYLSLVTDRKSRMIVGYHLSKSLCVDGSITALEMALKLIKSPRKYIHHSDRGVQYCSKAYTERLLEKNMKISMTDNGNPYENAIAERVNGILKIEFGLYDTFINFEQAKLAVDEAIFIYNNIRPHLSLNYETPRNMFNLINNKKTFKNYLINNKIFN